MCRCNLCIHRRVLWVARHVLDMTWNVRRVIGRVFHAPGHAILYLQCLVLYATQIHVYHYYRLGFTAPGCLGRVDFIT